MASAVGNHVNRAGPDNLPIRPVYIRLKHNGKIQQEGIVTQIIVESDTSFIDSSVFSAPPLDDEVITSRSVATLYTFYWLNGSVITVSAEEGWSWEVPEEAKLEDLPESVQNAINDSGAPTPPLNDYIAADGIGFPNLQWYLGAGHINNLLSEAVERLKTPVIDADSH